MGPAQIKEEWRNPGPKKAEGNENDSHPSSSLSPWEPGLHFPCRIFRLAQVSAQVGRPEGFDQRVEAARTGRATPSPSPFDSNTSHSLEEVCVPGRGPPHIGQNAPHLSPGAPALTSSLQNLDRLPNQDPNPSC